MEKLFFKYNNKGNFIVQHISEMLNVSISVQFSRKLNYFTLSHALYDGKIQAIIDIWDEDEWKKYIAFIDIKEESHETALIPIEDLTSSNIIFEDRSTVIVAKADKNYIYLFKISGDNLKPLHESLLYDLNKKIKIMYIERNQIRGYQIEDSNIRSHFSIPLSEDQTFFESDSPTELQSINLPTPAALTQQEVFCHPVCYYGFICVIFLSIIVCILGLLIVYLVKKNREYSLLLKINLQESRPLKPNSLLDAK